MSANLTYVSNYSDTTDTSDYVFSSCDIGPSSSDKIVYVAITGRTSAGVPSITGVTVAGNSATLVEELHAGSSSYNIASLWQISLSSGSASDIEVIAGVTLLRCNIGVYYATGTDATPTNTYSSNLTAPAASVDCNAGGFIIGIACTSAGVTDSTSWTGITEDYDVVLESYLLLSGAHDNFASAQSGLTCRASFTTYNNSKF